MGCLNFGGSEGHSHVPALPDHPRSGYRVYNPEGLDMTALREVVEAVRYPGLKLRRGQAG